MGATCHVENFGCRASQADGEAIVADLARRGLAPAPAASADVVILNTCCVTEEAERTARAYLRRARRQNPRARILVTGCYAQRAPQEVAALEGVHAVIGNSHKAMTAGEALAAAAAPPPGADFVPLASLAPILADDAFAHSDPAVHLTPAEAAGSAAHTRPNLKVQDGCGNRCSFCIIPTTRGHSRSLPLETCLGRVRAFAAGGGVELVLSGINLGRWGRDLSPVLSLEDLVEAILTRTALPRLRLSSIEPMDWSPRLLALFREYAAVTSPGGPRLARHAHLPLQSGSDAILRAMHRRYRPWHYAEKLRAIHAAVPEAAIGADVMTGFPGETDALFEETFAFLAALPFTYLHLFPFSPRPGTAALESHRRRPVSPGAVRERMGVLRALIAGKNLAFRQGFAGRTLPAITLHTPPEELARGRTRALSDNFLKIGLSATLPANLSLPVLITGISGEGLAAAPVAPE